MLLFLTYAGFLGRLGQNIQQMLCLNIIVMKKVNQCNNMKNNYHLNIGRNELVFQEQYWICICIHKSTPTNLIYSNSRIKRSFRTSARGDKEHSGRKISSRFMNHSYWPQWMLFYADLNKCCRLCALFNFTVYINYFLLLFFYRICNDVLFYIENGYTALFSWL